MDKHLLDRLSAEAAEECCGGVIHSVLPRPGNGIALFFGEDGRPALDLAAGPPRPRLAACTMRLSRGGGPPAAVLAAIQKMLCERRLAAIRVLENDRVVRLDLDDEQSLILEILGSATNVYLVASAERIVHRFREAGRPGGSLAVGAIWSPPPRPGEAAGGPDNWIVPAAVEELHPGLGAPVPEDEMDPLQPLAPAQLVIRWTGAGPADGAFRATRSLGDAVVLRDAWLARHEKGARTLHQLRSRLTGAAGRLERLEDALEQEERSALRHGEVRKWAEAILAGLSVARRQGDRLQVPDPYEPATSLEIPIDPARNDKANAEILFRQAARLKRGMGRVAEKRAHAARRSAEIAALLARLEEAGTLAALTALEAEVAVHDRPVGRRAKTAAPGPVSKSRRRLERDPRWRKIRRFELPEGWHLMVGGAARENDFLTFRLASSRDFWLHVADYPGAHVVVRNPGRREALPAEILRLAAAIAAHYSKAPKDEAVTVRWTQARHVRKAKGMPAGMVMLPRFSTLVVQASLPDANPYRAS